MKTKFLGKVKTKSKKIEKNLLEIFLELRKI